MSPAVLDALSGDVSGEGWKENLIKAVAEEAANPLLRQCMTCQKSQSDMSEALKHCGGCRAFYYCSRECQKKGWKTHKNMCPVIAGILDPANNPGIKVFEKLSDSVAHLEADEFPEGFSLVCMDIDTGKSVVVIESDAELFQPLSIFIDVFGLRAYDLYTIRGKEMGVYRKNPADRDNDFLEFITLAKERLSAMVPEWYIPAIHNQRFLQVAKMNPWNNILTPMTDAEIRTRLPGLPFTYGGQRRDVLFMCRKFGNVIYGSEISA